MSNKKMVILCLFIILCVLLTVVLFLLFCSFVGLLYLFIWDLRTLKLMNECFLGQMILLFVSFCVYFNLDGCLCFGFKDSFSFLNFSLAVLEHSHKVQPRVKYLFVFGVYVKLMNVWHIFISTYFKLLFMFNMKSNLQYAGRDK